MPDLRMDEVTSAQPALKASAEEGMHQRNSLIYKVKSAHPEEKYSVTR
jgi:hypothetical protein